jgi:hypothetical protein
MIKQLGEIQVSAYHLGINFNLFALIENPSVIRGIFIFLTGNRKDFKFQTNRLIFAAR